MILERYNFRGADRKPSFALFETCE